MNNNNWTVEQTRELFALCDGARREGKSLTGAFRRVAERTGRSVNSVRNYYYGQAKTFELVPEVADKLGIRACTVERERFVPFTDSEVYSLVECVLIAGGRGVSVRKAIYELAGGDDRLALRYQNKYRSVLRSHRKTVEEIMQSLSSRGIAYRDPYAKAERDNFSRLTEYLSTLDDNKVDKFLSIIEKLV
ncbi:MAG: hypothetical protein HDT28_00035 [Clostridiales bacterium]|nr:hypothetical protein [Clostridiales bacterium]